MSAAEIIEQIKELPADEQARVAKFIAENGSSMTSPQFSVGTEGDGLPVIRAKAEPSLRNSFTRLKAGRRDPIA